MSEKAEKRNITLNLQAQVFIDSNLSIAELFTIAGLYHNDFEDFVAEELFKQLEEKNYLNVAKFKVTLTSKGLSLMKSISEKTTRFKQKVHAYVDVNPVTDEFIDKYRKMFKHTKPGAMGFSKAVKTKMIRFFLENPKVTEEQILNATRRYIDSLDSYTYIQQADYFIYKRENNSTVESSRLSTFVEEGSNSTSNNDEDWTSKLI